MQVAREDLDRSIPKSDISLAEFQGAGNKLETSNAEVKRWIIQVELDKLEDTVQHSACSRLVSRRMQFEGEQREKLE